MGVLDSALATVWQQPLLLLAVLVALVLVLVVGALKSRPAPGPNPFAFDTARPPKPLVVDQDARDKVLKQGFSSKKIPNDLDAIVIGSGMGGLATAVLLAKVGRKVLVLEQHDQAGGCLHTYIEDGFEFDVGIHYIGEMGKGKEGQILMDQLTDGQLVWLPLDKDLDICAIGEPGKQRVYPFRAAGMDAWREEMIRNFPNEVEAIDKFIKVYRECRRNRVGGMMLKYFPLWVSRMLISTGLIHKMTKHFKYAGQTLKDVLDEITDNKELKTVLSYNFGDYGNQPSEGSFYLQTSLMNHFIGGGYYPRGGASEFAFHMIPLIEKAGGKVLVRAPVTQIVTNGNRAVGVKVQKGEEIMIKAPMIISGAGVMNTFVSLLPKEIAAKSGIYNLIQKKKVGSGLAAFSVFVGMRGSSEELGLKAQNVWAYTGNDVTELMKEYSSRKPEEVADKDIPLIFISFPSAKDASFSTRFPGKSTCILITFAPWEWFSKWDHERVKKRGQEYKNIKEAIAQKMWQQTVAMFPQLDGRIEYFEVGSPISNKYYLNAPKGEIYGLDHDVKRFGDPDVVGNLRPDIEIPGLYLTGQDVISCGFAGALYGGVFCAAKILNRNLFDDLKKLCKQVVKTQ